MITVQLQYVTGYFITKFNLKPDALIDVESIVILFRRILVCVILFSLMMCLSQTSTKKVIECFEMVIDVDFELLVLSCF